MGRVELRAAIDFLEAAVGSAKLGADKLSDDGHAREDVLKALTLGGDALRTEDEDVAGAPALLVSQAHKVRAFPHVSEAIECTRGVGEGHLPDAFPRAQVGRSVEQCGAGEVLTLDAEQHPVGAVGVSPHLGVAEVSGVAARLTADDRRHVLVKVDHVAGRDDALGGLALARLSVLVVAGVPQFHVIADLDRGARIGAVAILSSVGKDCRGVVVPMGQIRGRGVPPVDELARMLGRVLEERVAGAPHLDEPVGVVESPHGRGDVEEGGVGVLAGARAGLGFEGRREKVFGHAPNLTSGACGARGGNLASHPANTPRASEEPCRLSTRRSRRRGARSRSAPALRPRLPRRV